MTTSPLPAFAMVVHGCSENQYEQKLAMEMERYDQLSEEIEAIQQRCEGLLEAQTAEHEAKVPCLA